MKTKVNNNTEWFLACRAEDVPDNGGVCVKYKGQQIALFFFSRRNEWYASQNMCPHRQQMAISRGMLGSQGDEPKVACPFHKKTFSLIDGRCMNSDEGFTIETFDVKVKDGDVFIGLPADLEFNNHKCYTDEETNC
jgi:nitrite reductase (NADH) small subunit